MTSLSLLAGRIVDIAMRDNLYALPSMVEQRIISLHQVCSYNAVVEGICIWPMFYCKKKVSVTWKCPITDKPTALRDRGQTNSTKPLP